jgi:hypothetical protein
MHHLSFAFARKRVKFEASKVLGDLLKLLDENDFFKGKYAPACMEMRSDTMRQRAIYGCGKYFLQDSAL